MPRHLVLLSICEIALFLAGSPRAISGTSYAEYSEEKQAAYRYLMGGLSEEEKRKLTPPVVPRELPAARGNAATVACMDEKLKNGLYQVLADDDLREQWDASFHELGVWSTVSPDKTDYSRLKPLVERVEASSMSASEKMVHLGQAYLALGRIGTGEAMAFLSTRMTRDFWGSKMPETKTTDAESGESFTENARSLAIQAYGARGDAKSVARLESLAKKSEFSQHRELEQAIRYEVDNASDHRAQIEQDRAYYRFVRRGGSTSSQQTRDATAPQVDKTK